MPPAAADKVCDGVIDPRISSAAFGATPIYTLRLCVRSPLVAVIVGE